MRQYPLGGKTIWLRRYYELGVCDTSISKIPAEVFIFKVERLSDLHGIAFYSRKMILFPDKFQAEIHAHFLENNKDRIQQLRQTCTAYYKISPPFTAKP
jgi:hypothetical protein